MPALRRFITPLLNQRGQSPFLGGFFKGLASSVEREIDRREKVEDRKLRDKLIKVQEQQAAREQQKFEQEIRKENIRQQAIDEIVQGTQQFVPAESPPGATFEEEGPRFEQQRVPLAEGDLRSRLLRIAPQQAVTGMMRQPASTQDLATQLEQLKTLGLDVSPTGEHQLGVSMGPRGTTLSARPRQQAQEAANSVFQRVLRETGSIESALAARNHALTEAAASRSFGAEAGTTGFRLGEPAPAGRQPQVVQPGQQPQQLGGQAAPTVTQAPRPSPFLQLQEQKAAATTRGEPVPSEATKDIAQLETLTDKTLSDIRKNFNPNFLGPVKGTNIALETRRRVGSMIGAPLQQQETAFRLALNDADDLILRIRSGAQINEDEFRRMKAMLPKATDEPQVFLSALDRFEKQAKFYIERRKKLLTTPRGELSTPKRGRLVPIP